MPFDLPPSQPDTLHDDMSSSLDALCRALEQRDHVTSTHCDRVAQLARLVGTHCDLDHEQLGDLVVAARFHDIGKIGIPDRVLFHSGALGASDVATMHSHSARGEAIFRATGRADADRVATLIRHHHEAVDGSGYPDALAGSAIPLACRVLTLVDAYDAMTSDRPYRSAMAHADAIRRLGDAQQQQLDADVFKVFETLARRYVAT